MPILDTDIPSPVLENKDSSLLNTTLNDTDLLNTTLDGAMYSESKSTISEQKQQTPAHPVRQEQSCPSTPVKKEQPKVIVDAAQNADEMLDMLTKETVAKNYYFDLKLQSKKARGFFPANNITIKNNGNANDEYSRNTLEHLSDLFPIDATELKARFVVIAKKNDKTGKLEPELWFSRAVVGAISHAGTAFGAEKSGYSLSAGELHFIKNNGILVIEKINNQTGHFLCGFNALLLPIKLLLNHQSLWGDTVEIGQILNTKIQLNESKSTALCYHKINVDTLKNRLHKITVTLPESVPEVITSLDAFGSPKVQRTSNLQSRYSSVPFFSGFNLQETGSDPHAMSQQVQQINDPVTYNPPFRHGQSSHLSVCPPLPLPGVNANAVNSSVLPRVSITKTPETSPSATKRGPMQSQKRPYSGLKRFCQPAKDGDDPIVNELVALNLRNTTSVFEQQDCNLEQNDDKTVPSNYNALSKHTIFSSNSSVINHGDSGNKALVPISRKDSDVNFDFSFDLDCDTDLNSSMSRRA